MMAEELSQAWKGQHDEHSSPCEVELVEYVMPLQRIYQRLKITPEKLTAFCEKWQIVELALFGSVLRDDFRLDGKDQSDIDVLYSNAPEARYGLEFFDMKEELESLLNRKVDFISKRSIQNSRNWLRRKSILESSRVIYAKRSTVTY